MDDTKTITRADLAEAVYAQVGLSRKESSDLVEQLLDEMMAALVSGDNVKISSFGSFSVREKGERIGRNPKTGVEVPISPRKVLVFRASHVLKDKINKATQAATYAKFAEKYPDSYYGKQAEALAN